MKILNIAEFFKIDKGVINMAIQATTHDSGDVGLPNTKVKPTPIFNEKEVYTHEEVFGDVNIEQFSLEDALEILDFSEAEFREQLDARGFCQTKDFDKNGKFPVEWISALDTLKWIVD